MIKNFVIFFGESYYPAKGWDDYHSSFDNLADALLEAKSLGEDDYEWCHIIDLSTGKKVYEV